MITKNNIAILLAFFLAVIGGFLLWNNKGNHTVQQEVKVGYTKQLINLPLMIAQENNLFEEEGIVVNLLELPDTYQLRDALAAGKIDIAVSLGTEDFFKSNNTSANGFSALYFNVLTDKRYVDAIIVKGDSPYKTLQDLNGKKVGVFPAPTVRMYAQEIAKSSGVAYTIQDVQPSIAFQALAAGEIDALYALEPQIEFGKAKANFRVLMEAPATRYMKIDIPVGAQLVSNASIKRLSNGELAAYQRGISHAVSQIELSLDNAKINAEKILKYPEGILENARLPLWVSACEMIKTKDMERYAVKLEATKIIQHNSPHPDKVLCLQ